MIVDVYDRKNVVQGDVRPLDGLVNSSQSLHWAEKSANVTEKSEQCSRGNFSLKNGQPSQRDRGNPSEGDHQIRRRAEAGINAHAADHGAICGFYVAKK